MNYEQKYHQLVLDLTSNYERQTPAQIRSLYTSQVFVFGTDRYGSQKFGAAGFAAKVCDAAVGVSEGLTGRAYAIPTQGFSFEETADAIVRFVEFARSNPNYIFLVTPIGCGHAGHSVETIAPLFKDCVALKNVWLPYDFICYYRKEAIDYLGLKQKKEEVTLDAFAYYDSSVYDVLRYLAASNIPFNEDGGFCLKDKDDMVIAEAELGIESEKVVFFPFNSPSEIAFKNNGYKICTPEEYLKSKLL